MGNSFSHEASFAAEQRREVARKQAAEKEKAARKQAAEDAARDRINNVARPRDEDVEPIDYTSAIRLVKENKDECLRCEDELRAELIAQQGDDGQVLDEEGIMEAIQDIRLMRVQKGQMEKRLKVNYCKDRHAKLMDVLRGMDNPDMDDLLNTILLQQRQVQQQKENNLGRI